MSKDVKDAFVCPNCHSEQIQSYELIYAQNVSSSTHTTTGVGISTGGGLGSGVATTSGTSVTALGEVVAPPMMKGGMGKKKGCLFAFGVFILGSILGGIVGSVLGKSVGDFVVILALAGFIFYQYKVNKDAKKWNAEIYPQLYEEWRHNYMCMKCGHSFKV